MNGGTWYPIPPEWENFINTPMSFADVRLFFGDQGQGKSITAVASMVDDVYQYVTHIVSPEGEIIKAHALNEEEQAFLQAPMKDGGLGILYDHLKYMRIFNDDGTKSKIVSVPVNYVVLSPVKVFANRTLYGLRYMKTGFEELIAYINTPLMTNGWVVISESVLVDKRDTGTLVGKFMVWFAAECRKRHLRMVIDSQYPSMVQSRFHLFATTRVECSYDSDSMIVSLDVNKNSPIMNSTTYYSYHYRRFFNTDEHMEIPQGRIDKALETVVG